MVENIEISYKISLSAESQKQQKIDESKITENKKLIDKLTDEIKKIQDKPDSESKSNPSQKDTKTKTSVETKKESNLTEGEEFIQSVDSKGLSNLRSLSNDPTQLLTSNFLSFLTKGGPQTAIIAALITTAISSPETLSQIVKALAAPGGPLNRDWKRFIESQVDIGLSRIQLERRETGRDILALPQRLGFIPANEAWASSNIISVDAKRTARIGLTDKEQGLFE